MAIIRKKPRDVETIGSLSAEDFVKTELAALNGQQFNYHRNQRGFREDREALERKLWTMFRFGALQGRIADHPSSDA